MRPWFRAGWGVSLLVASVGGGLFVASSPAGATTTSVTLYVRAGATGTGCSSSATADACGSVGQAVEVAESSHGGDDVTITVGPGTYAGTYGIEIGSADASLTIEGAGAGPTGSILTGEGRGTIFAIEADGHPVTIEEVTIAHGTAGSHTVGGGALVESSHVTFSNDTFSTDDADAGGGVFVTPLSSHLTFSDDTFKSDHAEYGGAALVTDAIAVFSDDTFTHDRATDLGGGIFSYEATTSMFNATFFDDEAGTGGALANIRSTVLTVDTTIATDSATTTGGGIYTTSAYVVLFGSILSNATCGGERFYEAVFDVQTGDTCDFGPTSVSTSATIGLHRLAANTSTGPETMAIGPTSSAFELVPLAECGTTGTDERGAPRPGIATQNCDAGAYEFQTGTVLTVMTATTITPSNVLYVRSGATGASCTAPTSAKACGSIAEALGIADTGTGTVLITVGPGTYGEDDLTVSAEGLTSLTIRGTGPSSSTIDAGGLGSVFLVASGTLTVTGFSITHGAASDGYGGAFDTYATAPTSLTLRDDVLSTDSAGRYGGAVNVTAAVAATFVDDTFSNDSSSDGGGAIANYDGTVHVTNSTLSGDAATYGGAYLGTDGAHATFSFDTVATDTGLYGTGGILDTYFRTVTTISDSIFSSATCAGPTGTFHDDGYNVETGDTCGFSGSSKSTSTTIDLHPLAGYDVTEPETMAIGPTSSAYGLVPRTSCSLSTDERGKPRPGPAGPNCDAGAFEYQSSATIPGTTSSACPVSSLACDTGSPRAGRTVVVGSNGVKVTGTGGRGTVGVGTYRHDPAGPLPSSTGKFFAVSLSSGSTLKTVVVTVCGVGTGTALEWWNGSAWEHVVASTGASSGPGGDCISVTLGPSTTPSLATIARMSRMSRFGAVLFGVVH